MKAFANEPILELRRAPMRAQLRGRARASSTPSCRCACRCGSATSAREGDELVSTDPGAPDRVVAEAAAATPRRGRGARWRSPRRGRRDVGARRRPSERAEVLRRAPPTWLRERRLELAALEVRECAKPWPEADADVCEAIDFLEYYARGAVDLDAGRRRCSRCRASATSCATRRAASSR